VLTVRHVRQWRNDPPVRSIVSDANGTSDREAHLSEWEGLNTEERRIAFNTLRRRTSRWPLWAKIVTALAASLAVARTLLDVGPCAVAWKFQTTDQAAKAATTVDGKIEKLSTSTDKAFVTVNKRLDRVEVRQDDMYDVIVEQKRPGEVRKAAAKRPRPQP